MFPYVAISYVSYAWCDRTYGIIRTESGHMVCIRMCYTEKALPTRHRPERQHNARSNRRKQCSPNETKPYKAYVCVVYIRNHINTDGPALLILHINRLPVCLQSCDVTRRKQHQPGITPNDNTAHVVSCWRRRSTSPPAAGACMCPHYTYTSVVTSMSVTRRKLQTPGTAEEHKRQETPTINPIDPTDKPHRPSTKHYQV